MERWVYIPISYNLETREGDIFHLLVLIALDIFRRCQLNKVFGDPLNLFGFISEEQISYYCQASSYVSSGV
jgi:hypothetical protein